MLTKTALGMQCYITARLPIAFKQFETRFNFFLFFVTGSLRKKKITKTLSTEWRFVLVTVAEPTAAAQLNLRNLMIYNGFGMNSSYCNKKWIFYCFNQGKALLITQRQGVGEGVMVCSCVALRSGGAAVCLFYAQAQVGWSLLIYLAAKYKMITPYTTRPIGNTSYSQAFPAVIVMLPTYHSLSLCAVLISQIGCSTAGVPKAELIP